MTRRLLWMILVATGLSGFVIGAVTSQDWWAWSWIGYPIVGGIVIWKQPANVIGRLLVGIGLGWGLTFVAEALIARSIASPGIELASEPLGYLPWLLMVDLTLVFPSGRATTTMTRWLRRAVVIVGGIVLVSLLVDPAPLELSGRPSPLGVEAARGITNFILQEQGFLIVPALLLLGLAGLFVRWRRSTGVERLQLQWFVSALVATILILASEGIIPSQLNFDLVAPVVLNLLPLAIGVAVLRYRLFEIDRVISRTVGFVLVAAIIAVVYGFGAVWLPTQIVGEQTPLFVAGSTLLVAALFNPLRRRVMKAVERRFHRGHYDAASVVDRFSQRLLNEVDVTHVTGDLMTLVSGTLRPTSVGLWLRKD